MSITSVIDYLSLLLRQLAAVDDDKFLISHEERVEVPDDVWATMAQLKIVQQVQYAKSIICDGCEENCVRPVVIYQANAKSPARAFIVCDVREDGGRVNVEFERLNQWLMSKRQLAEMVRELLGNSTQSVAKDVALWRLGMVDGGKHKSQVSLKFDSDVMVLAGGHKVPLMELLSFEKDALKIDLKKIKKMVNESTGFSDDVESTKARNARMLKRKNELKSQKVRNFNQQIANEENLSLATVKNAISSAEKEQNAQSTPQSSNKFKNIFPTQSSQSKN
ncbi:MAG: hypothetical protein LWW76_09695 [Burkholderiales bacterium]|nr:hypothetical protein [Burkholderiales bacterium]